MKLLSLEAKNLFSLDKLRLSLDKRGLVLVTGFSHDESSANGSGKSTIANKAILWTLFGQTAGGTRGDDVINRWATGKVKCHGIITLRDNQGALCRIKRTRKPASLTYEKWHAEVLPNGVIATDTENWIDLSRRNVSDTQELINEDIGRDFLSYMQTDFFGQGRSNDFLSLTPSQQTDILEQILPIKELSEWSESAKKAKKELDEEIDRIGNGISYWEGAHAQVVTDYEEAQRKSLSFIANQMKKIGDLAKEIEEYDDSVKDKRYYLKGIQNELATMPNYNLDAAKETYEMIDGTLRKSMEDLEVCKGVERKAETEIRVTEASLLDIREDCPTCEQPWPEEARAAMVMKQHEIGGELAERRGTLREATIAIKGWERHVINLEGQRNLAKKAYDNAVAEMTKQNKLNIEIEVLTKVINEEARAEMVAKAHQLETEENPYTAVIEAKLIAKQDIGEKAASLMKQHVALTKERDYLSSWAGIFGKDFKTFLFKRACPFLEQKTAEHLSGLGNDQLKVKFSTSKTLKSGDEKSGFSIGVHSETGGLGFDNLSGGEQQMVSFAVGLALADLAETQVKGGSNLLILDEPFMALDDRNCENLVTYLTSVLSLRRETILLISNEENLKALISERIHVEKVGGISSVEMGI